MDFELTDEQHLIRETARDFTDNEIVERARENDRNEHFDLELVQMIAATRAYQLNATMLTLQDQTLGRAVNDVGRVG